MEDIRTKEFKRRVLFLGGLKALGVSALCGRLYFLQVVKYEEYKYRADKNRIYYEIIVPSRGLILDLLGRPIATNIKDYHIFLELESKDFEEVRLELPHILEELTKILPPDGIRNLKYIEDDLSKHYAKITLCKSATYEQLEPIESRHPPLPFVNSEEREIRSYPCKKATAHVLGYVNAVTKNDQKNDPVLKKSALQKRLQIGNTGIEQTYEYLLRGKAGKKIIQKNAKGETVSVLDKQESQPGQDIHLTLDRDFQEFIQRRLEPKQQQDSETSVIPEYSVLSVSSVIMDVHTGAVYGLASSPSFDPHKFTTGWDTEEWREMEENPRKPLLNKAIAGEYHPGSTFKLVTSLAALHDQVVSPEFTVFCPGHLDVGNRSLRCWRRNGHGKMNMHSAIEQSCDVYFYEISRLATIDRIVETAIHLGLGEKLGIDLQGEKTGLVPTKSWRKDHRPDWQIGHTMINGIGQDAILTTPLQLATLTARLVNGGYAVVPHLRQKSPATNPQINTFPRLKFSESHLKFVFDAMVAVTMSPRGTAYRARIPRIPYKGMEMGGKTGTSQVKRLPPDDQRNTLPPWKDRDHALFIAFAPIHNPRYAISVVVEHGDSGSVAAAPIARDILLDLQQRVQQREQE